jgi:hypothetical protein
MEQEVHSAARYFAWRWRWRTNQVLEIRSWWIGGGGDGGAGSNVGTAGTTNTGGGGGGEPGNGQIGLNGGSGISNDKI